MTVGLTDTEFTELKRQASTYRRLLGAVRAALDEGGGEQRAHPVVDEDGQVSLRAKRPALPAAIWAEIVEELDQ